MWFEHAPRCCKFRAQVSDPRIKTAPCCNLSRASPWMTYPSCRGSSLRTSWVYGYDPETKQQSSQWKSPRSPRKKKARQSRSTTNSMLIVFFNIQGIVHHEFAPKAGPWTPGSTAVFFAVWGRIFGKHDLNCGAQAIGCSIMTIHPLTELS